MKAFWMLLFLLACTPAELSFAPWDSGLPKTGEWRTNLALADVNKDGLLDIGAIGRKGHAYASVWLNQGNGSWQKAIEGIPQTMQCGVGVDFGDVNNDGNMDVAFGQHCGGAAAYLGNGAGTWTNHSNGLSSENVNPIALADFDNDGLLDLITLGAFTEGFVIYKNTGTIWLQQTTNLPTEVNSTSYTILTADVNKDGRTDIISTGGSIFVFLNKENFTFEQSTGLDAKGFFAYLALGDINNDGLLDIAASSNQNLLVYRQNQDHTWKLQHNLTLSCGGIALADINNDRHADLIASCANGMKMFRGPKLTDLAHNLPKQEGLPHGLHVEDINNDGRQDIIAAFGKETNLGREGVGGIYVWVQT